MGLISQKMLEERPSRLNQIRLTLVELGGPSSLRHYVQWPSMDDRKEHTDELSLQSLLLDSLRYLRTLDLDV